MTRQEAVAELSEEKRLLLAQRDLTWVWTHDAWASKASRKIIFQDWMRAVTIDGVRSALTEPAPPAQWQQFCLAPPPEQVISNVIAALG